MLVQRVLHKLDRKLPLATLDFSGSIFFALGDSAIANSFPQNGARGLPESSAEFLRG